MKGLLKPGDFGEQTFYLFVFVSGEVYYLFKGNAVKLNTSENDPSVLYFVGPSWKI